MAILIDGKTVANNVKKQISNEVETLKNNKIIPGLAVIIVGSDPASRVYVNNKKKACNEVNIYSEEYALDENTSEQQLLDLINKLNKKESINGILVQLPLPKHINPNTIINAIDPKKDVDAFHPYNVGKIMTGDFSFLPCTPAGIMELLNFYNIKICSKNCVVIGRSNIVGKPMAMLLLHNNATVTICHSKTTNLIEICKTADILIAAVGKPNFVKSNMIKPGAILIDVGINRNSKNKLCGDIDFDNVFEKASYITPVPGGVGPMTICMLLKNTLTAAKIQNHLLAFN